MIQLGVLAGSFLLMGWLVFTVLSFRKSLPALPSIEPNSPEHLEKEVKAAAQALPWRRFALLRFDTRSLRLVRRLLRCRQDLASLTFIRKNSRDLYMSLISFKEDLRHCPRLPAATPGTPRMLLLCRRYLALGGSVDASHLLSFLSACLAGGTFTYHERLHMPLCMYSALTEQLISVLRHILLAANESCRGVRLARRLARARRPMELLNAQHLSITETQAMVYHLQERHEAHLLAALEERMHQDDYSLLRLADAHAAQQAMLTDHLSRILNGFHALRKLDWPALVEPADPIHQLFEHDPTGTYPAMDAESRALYRQRAAELSRLFSVDEIRLSKDILILCGASEPDGLGDHVGWYLLEHRGIRALQRHLHVRRGFLRLWLWQFAPWVHRGLLGVSAFVAALIFLHSGHPLWMLPFFLGVSSCLSHFLLDPIGRRLSPAQHLPRMEAEQITEDLRTLIVLPTVLNDKSSAVPAVRRLLLARKAFPEGAVDCLLLADYAPCLTQTSSEDPATLMAARMAIASVDGDGGQFIYMHRRRQWDITQRAYAGRDGLNGAMESLNKLIVHGESPDIFDESTLPPASLHRRYAYVLALDGDAMPLPDALLSMIGTLSHPLNERRHTAEGIRGLSMIQPRLEGNPAAIRSRIGLWEDPLVSPACLYRPYSLLESTETWFPPQPLLARELSGCAQDASATFCASAPHTVSGWLHRLHYRIQAAWNLLPWLFSHVKSPSGVRRNPLSSHSKHRFRQELRLSFLPICRVLLLFYALLSRSMLLLVFSLLIPDLPLASPGRFLVRLGGLPLRAVIAADAMLHALWHALFPHRKRPDWLPSFLKDQAGQSAWENWSQGLASIAFAVAALAIQPVSLAGLLLGALFACFPLMRPWLDALLRPLPRPTPEAETSLLEIAQATWQFFEETVTEAAHFLPPESLQLKPWRGPAQTTTPQATGLYLLSCLAMRELGLISTDDMCQRVSRTMNALEQLPLWHGLPYQRYHVDTLTVSDPAFVSSAECGILCACLITLAQGLRSYLPEIPDGFSHLPHQVDQLAHGMELHRLYDFSTQLFFTGYHRDTDTLDPLHHELYATETLLLSFAAIMSRQVPASHFARLHRLFVRLGHEEVCLSQLGTAAEYLLPALVLPAAPHTMMDRTLRAIIHAQQRQGAEGMFGFSESACWQFDAHLNYQRHAFGVQEAALSACASGLVIAPYAAALCLPFDLEKTYECLMRLRSRGMLTRLGFFDSIDFSPAHLPGESGEAMVQSHIASHQGMLLCALCNALTGKILVRHFSSVPEAAAFLPLLHTRSNPRLILPPRYIHPENTLPKEPPYRRHAHADIAPVDAHIIGNHEAALLMSAQGMGVMHSRGVTLTHFTGDPTQIEGIQFYLNDGLETYHLTDPFLPGDTCFSEGSIRFIRACGQLQTTLTAITDPVQGSFLHIIEVSNLTAQHRTFDLASCLVADLNKESTQEDFTIESGRPEERVLTLTRLPSNQDTPRLTLCHAISTHEPLLALAAQTDLCAFQGRNRSLRHPAGLEAPLQDGLLGAPVTPCASFRARLKLGPRGRAAVIFVTRLMRPGEIFSLEALAPRVSEVDSLTTLSSLLSRTITDSLSISQPRAAELSRLFGPLMWRCQPHQGAVTPLTQPPVTLEGLGLNPLEPIMLLIIHSEGCVSLLQDVSDGAQWLELLGQSVQLCVLCQGEEADQARRKAWSMLRNRPATLLMGSDMADGLRETLEAAARLILYEGAGTITAQLEALSLRLPSSSPAEAAAPPEMEVENLRFDNGIGGFQTGTDDYVIRLPQEITTPAPWHSLLSNKSFLTLCTESGLCASRTNGDACVTLPNNDPFCPVPAECVYLADGDRIFTPTPLPLGQGLACRVHLTPGVTTWRSLGYDLDMTLTAAAVPDATFGCRTLRIKNMSNREQRFTMTIAARLLMGEKPGDEAYACLTPVDGGVVAASPLADRFGCLALAEGRCESRVVSPLAFHGYGATPNLDAPEDEAGTLALLRLPLTIPAGGSMAITWLLGACRQMDEAEALLARLRAQGSSAIYREVRQLWNHRLGKLTLSTPDDSLNLLMNRVLPWQIHAFPPADRHSPWNAAALVYTEHHTARSMLLSSAAQPDAQDGTQLLLPFMTSWYILRTGDKGILAEQVTPSQATGSLYAHCLQALTSIRLGVHGLPLSGGAESVALALFFAHTLHLFAPYAQAGERAEIEDVRARVLESVERAGWDGSWYLHAFLEDGAPLGSANAHACRIHSLDQSLAVLALGVTEHTTLAADQAWQQLFDPRRGLLRQFAPPFDGRLNKSPFSPCVPGLGDNGTHSATTAIWMFSALCELTRADRAWALLQSLNPVLHGGNPERYRLEPYILAEHLFTHPQQLGRGSGFSHSAGLLYALVLEKLLGFEKRGDQVRLRPMAPPDWDSFTLTLQWGGATWRFHAGAGEPLLTCDGEAVPTGWITLVDDGRIHEVRTPLRRG